MARRPQRMGLIERAVVEDLVVDGTGRNENEATDAGSPGGLNQLQRAVHVLMDKLNQVTLGTTKSHPWSVQPT